MCQKCLGIIYLQLLTSRSLGRRTNKKTEEKLTIKRWPQQIYRMDCLGLGIHQRLLASSFFGYFLCKHFYTVFQGHHTDPFPRIWDLNIQSVFSRLSFLFLTLGQKMPRNTCILCLKIPIFFLKLASKILADLNLELQLFKVMEFCV